MIKRLLSRTSIRLSLLLRSFFIVLLALAVFAGTTYFFVVHPGERQSAAAQMEHSATEMGA